MNDAICSNEESTKKMNTQIHVLSAKYIDFDAKINHHLFEFNRSKEQKIDACNVIDVDSLHFTIYEKQSTEHWKDFCFENSAANRFRGKLDVHHFTSHIVVRVEFAAVKSLSKFVREMKNQFEKRIGAGTVKEIIIIDCKTAENTLHQIDIKICFNSLMNHGHLNDIRFPTN